MIPEHVLSAFQVDGIAPTPLGDAWDRGARFDHVVIAPATATAAWSAKVRERFSSPGLLLARPVRATDGRVVVAGFKANEYIEGEPAARADEAIAAALAYDKAMADVQGPSVERTDPWAEADREVWGTAASGPARCVAHLDFFACCIFSGTLPPALTDVVPSVEPRPTGYTAALTLVDALLTQSVDDRVISRWAHIPHLTDLAGKALEYREATLGELPPGSNAYSNIGRVRDLLMSA